jgi:hypothetical protein
LRRSKREMNEMLRESGIEKVIIIPTAYDED